MEKTRRALRIIFIKLVTLYQRLISPYLSPSCRFIPTCSEYAKQAIERHGILKGLLLTTKRILRCNPYHDGGYDPVPENFFKES